MTPKNEVRVVLLLEKIVDLLEEMAARRSGPALTEAPDTSPAAAPETPSSQPAGEAILACLQGLGVQVKATGTANSLDRALADTACFIGDHYAAVQDLLSRIKSALPYHGSLHVDLKGRPPEVVQANLHLAGELHRIAFLESYQYLKAPRSLIQARPSGLPAAQRFFTGHWFEIYCREKILAWLRGAGLEDRAQLLHNVQVKLPDGEDFEFDLLLWLDGRLFWFEQKSGSYQHNLEKYARLADRLVLDRNHAFLVLAQAGEKTAQVLGDLCGMTVCTTDTLERELDRAFTASGRATAEERAGPVADSVEFELIEVDDQSFPLAPV